MPSEGAWVRCQKCGARLKQGNLEKHYSGLHPGERPQVAVAQGAQGAERAWLLQLLLPGIMTAIVVVLVAAVVYLLQFSRKQNFNVDSTYFGFLLLLVAAVSFGVLYRTES